MSEDQKAKASVSPTERKKFWNRIKKYSIYYTSIAGAIATAIVIYNFIQTNHKRPDLTGEWLFHFSVSLPTAELRGLQGNYNISIRQSGSRNEILEGSGNHCADSSHPDSVHFANHLIIVGSKFDDDSLLLNYDLLNHSEVMSNGVIKFGINAQKDGCYSGSFYNSTDDIVGTLKASRILYIKR